MTPGGQNVRLQRQEPRGESKESGVDEFEKYFTCLADFDFLFLVDVLGAITQRAGHVPAHVATVELPGRALLFYRADFLFPAAQ